MFHTVQQTLFSIDIRTLIAVLMWGNLLSAFLVFMFKVSIPFARDKSLLSYCICSRALLALAFFLLFCRGLLPDVLSVNVGNSLLLSAFYLESQAMLAAIGEERKIYSRITGSVALACVAGLNVAEYIAPDPAVRVMFSSLGIFLILCVSTLRMALSKGYGNFKKTVSLFYAVFLCLILYRALWGLRDAVHLFSASSIQSMAFLTLILMMLLSLPAYLLMAKEAADKILLDMATTDALTGLRNRHGFLDLAGKFYQNHIDTRSHLSLLFMDIDNFKQINDAHGHDFGDTVLAGLADILKKQLRPVDLHCRYGGEEFVVLLPRADARAANAVAVRIMRGVSEAAFASHPDFSFTLSIGISSGIPQTGQSLDEYIAWADKAMYAAKRAGKNKVVTYVSTGLKYEMEEWGTAQKE